MSDPPISSHIRNAFASSYSRHNLVKAGILSTLFGVFYVFVMLLESGFIMTLPSRPFLRDDTSLMLSYRRDTVSELSVSLTIFLLGPACLVAAVLAGRFSKDSENKPFLPGGLPVLLWAYIHSFAIVFFVADLCQFSVGALRPDFLDRCKPTSDPQNFADEYLRQEDVCTGDWTLILKGRRSFPSLHASLSSSAATFVIACLHWSIQSRRENIFQSVAKMIFSMPPLGWAVWVCMTRISDNRHHMHDVVAGAILGTAVSLLCFYIVIARLANNCIDKKAPGSEDLELGQTFVCGDPVLAVPTTGIEQ